MRTVEARPNAAALAEGMRDIGYSLGTALADIVDNSITAGAKTIKLFADTATADLKVGILDDGCGMSDKELYDAMRPGSQNPSERRARGDLGRFGLGLKTASFSQCRRVTVVTRKDDLTSSAIWDLDFLAEVDDWLVQVPDDLSEIPWLDQMSGSGTLIIWDKLDRLTSKGEAKSHTSDLVRQVDEASDHLELIYHRFLSGDRRAPRVRILLNERPLEPFDPFHSDHLATIKDPEETIKVGGHEVEIQTYTLPHHRKVSQEEWERYAGREGYVKNQGFYVYRENRLIIHGTWFGLARQQELTKLARVRIDLPNELDSQWKIDVKKASAQPPFQVRDRLRRIIETIGATSRRVYTGRGKRLVSDSRLPVWNRVQDKNEISYRINHEHPVLVDFMSRLPDDLRNDFLRVVEISGATLPVDALFADMGGEPQNMATNATSEDALLYATITTYRQLVDDGMPSAEVLAMMEVADPFRSNWSRTLELLRDAFPEESFDG